MFETPTIGSLAQYIEAMSTDATEIACQNREEVEF